MGLILVNRACFNSWIFQKMSITKNVAPKLIFYNEKKNYKVWDNFWLWMSEIGTFGQLISEYEIWN